MIKIKESISNGLVGIWWYYKHNLLAKKVTLDEASLDGYYLQYSTTQNHASLWKSTINDYIEDKDEAAVIISKGYKSLERGRVIYDTRTASYLVICGSSLINDVEFRRECIKDFHLPPSRTDFQALDHYHVAELTGNPVLDEFEYGL